MKTLHQKNLLTHEEYGQFKKDKLLVSLIQGFPAILAVAGVIPSMILTDKGGDYAKIGGVLMIAVVVCILLLFYTIPIGMMTKAGRRFTRIRRIALIDAYDTSKAMDMKKVLSKEANIKLSKKAIQQSVVLFLIPIVIVLAALIKNRNIFLY